MREATCSTHHPDGFTLIEVIGALVIFAVGVLMVIQTSGALTTQMQYSARTSEMVVVAHERLDSLESMPFDSLSEGVTTDTVTLSGAAFVRRAQLTLETPLRMKIEVALTPADTAAGPSYTATSYAAAEWW